ALSTVRTRALCTPTRQATMPRGRHETTEVSTDKTHSITPPPTTHTVRESRTSVRIATTHIPPETDAAHQRPVYSTPVHDLTQRYVPSRSVPCAALIHARLPVPGSFPRRSFQSLHAIEL